MSIRLSYTANDLYHRSPRAYYLHYVLKLRPEQTGSALVFGHAIDSALNVLLTNHFGGKNDGSPEEILRMLLTQATVNDKLEDLQTTDKVSYYKSDLDPTVWTESDKKEVEAGVKPELVTLRRKGIMMLDAYREQVLPNLSELISSQKFVEIKNPEGDRIVGFVDLIARFSPKGDLLEKYREYDGKIVLFDNKTSSIKYQIDSVKESKQLATYSQVPEVEADACGYIVIPKKFRKEKKPLVPIEIIVDKVSDSMIESIFNEYEETLSGIKLGKFDCTGKCLESPFGCPYKRYCESNGTDLTGLIYADAKEPRKT